MELKVRYFASLREAVGKHGEAVDWAGPTPSLRGFLAFLADRHPALRALPGPHSLLCAVNQEYAGGDRELKEGDEVALFPPVSGG